MSIANHFGISPHLLQQFNGNVVLKVGDAVRIPAPIATYPPQSITYTPPTCYETPTDALFCLGEVTNTQSYAIGRVTLRLTLTRPDGRELTSQVVHIAARWLPPGQSAPYRAIFNDKSLAPMDASNAYYGMVVTPLSADRIPDSIFGRFVTTLEIVDEGMRSQNNYVIMSGTIVNRGLQVVENVRVVVTLYNAHGQVAGYRMVEVPHVEAGESLPLRMVMLPTTDAKLARPLSATWFVDVPVIP